MVPHDYYTDSLFGYGAIDVPTAVKRHFIKYNLKDIRYPVAEWNDFGEPEEPHCLPADAKAQFDEDGASVYGPLLVVDRDDPSCFIVMDFSKREKTNDEEQQLYGDLVATNFVARPLLAENVEDFGKVSELYEAPGTVDRTAPVKCRPEDDALVYGPRIPSLPKIEGLEYFDFSERIHHRAPEGFLPLYNTFPGLVQGDVDWAAVESNKRRPKTVVTAPASTVKKSAPAKAVSKLPSKFEIVELKTDDDLKALPEAPLLNKLRPGCPADSGSRFQSGAVVLKLCPEILLGRSLAVNKYPSVSDVLDVTMKAIDRKRLTNWRALKIKELGEEGFGLSQQNILSNGEAFRAAVRSVLTSSSTTITTVNVPDWDKGLWQSVRKVFHDITDVVSLNERSEHPFLCYHGQPESVVSLEGQQCLVEWKTSTTKADTVLALQSNPVQVAAYLGALNFDRKFADRKLQLRTGAVVVAYESGEPASVVRLDYDKIRPYWTLWLKRLQQYWRLASVSKALPEPKNKW
ncbi:putative Mitochondrial genome maintenance exonuclease 1 [Hypsibius exemplaris]|uniref:Mitochondrial genome maintenance exonuclease 1 n=1 Tax=Hypsibius exemplaris TaxID=2072580 RepID=A0A1W0WSF3_HYPEX|nr:putative Mitochondrial genome maintenance exonuclease 1 [Hypsibius exemplaris]